MPIYCVDLVKSIDFRFYVDAPDEKTAEELVIKASLNDDIDDNLVDGSEMLSTNVEEVEDDEVYERVEEGIDLVHNVDGYLSNRPFGTLNWE